VQEYKTKHFSRVLLNMWEAQYKGEFQGCLFIYDEGFEKDYNRSGHLSDLQKALERIHG
jgi:hypothetical protein